MADWGMKISQGGIDVKTGAGGQLIFSSGNSIIPVVATGTSIVNLSNATGTVEGTTQFLTPLAIVVPIASTVMNGKRFLSNAPALIGSSSPSDQHYFSAALNGNDSTTNIITLTIGRFSGSSMNGVAESYTVRWFLIGFA